MKRLEEKEEKKTERQRELKKKTSIFFRWVKKSAAASHFSGTLVYQEIQNFTLEGYRILIRFYLNEKFLYKAAMEVGIHLSLE